MAILRDRGEHIQGFRLHHLLRGLRFAHTLGRSADERLEAGRHGWAGKRWIRRFRLVGVVPGTALRVGVAGALTSNGDLGRATGVSTVRYW